MPFAMPELICPMILLIVVVVALCATISGKNLARVSVVRVCIWAMLIAVFVGPAMGVAFWLLDRFLFHSFHDDGFTDWPRSIEILRMFTTIGAVAGSIIGFLWGMITVLASLRGRKP